MPTLTRSGLRRLLGAGVGKWAGWLSLIFVAMLLVSLFVLIPLGSRGVTDLGLLLMMQLFSFAMMLCGLAAGGVGLFALARHRKRTWSVWLAVFCPVLLALFFLLGEFLVPH